MRQDTRFKALNGDKIYEGDIVMVKWFDHTVEDGEDIFNEYDKEFVVRYGNSQPKFCIESVDGKVGKRTDLGLMPRDVICVKKL